FGVLDSDAILQAMANHLGSEVVTIRDGDLSPQVIESIPARVARTCQCLPVGLVNSTLKVALADPLNPARIDEIGFVVKNKEVQVVVADPVAIQKAIEKYYPEGADAASESVAELLKELGADTELAREAAGAAENVSIMEDMANQAPIVRF